MTMQLLSSVNLETERRLNLKTGTHRVFLRTKLLFNLTWPLRVILAKLPYGIFICICSLHSCIFSKFEDVGVM